jgi:hypothetical protein
MYFRCIKDDLDYCIDHIDTVVVPIYTHIQNNKKLLRYSYVYYPCSRSSHPHSYIQPRFIIEIEEAKTFKHYKRLKKIE